MSPSACSKSTKSKSFKGSQGSELSLRVGIVPEHFSAPLFLMAMDEQHQFVNNISRPISIPEHGNNEIGRGASGNSDSDGPRQSLFEPISMPCGTGEMIAALENEDIDISVSLTEGIIAKSINQRLQALHLATDEKNSFLTTTGSNEHVQDSFLTIMGLYVSSPLTWSIAIAPQSNMTRSSELDGGKIGISRYGSGSHIMAIILGVNLGISFEFVVCGSITGLLQAVQEGKIDAFLWELITTKPYYEEGRVKMLDSLTSPWPAFVFASTISSSKNNQSKMVEFLTQVPTTISRFMDEFETKGRSYILSSPRFHYESESDLNSWFASTRFTSNIRRIERSMLEKCIKTLVEAGVIDGVKLREWEQINNRKMTEEICHKLIGAVVDEINGHRKNWSLSRLSVPENYHISSFYSPPGITRKEKSVGRWHTPGISSQFSSESISHSLSDSFRSISQPSKENQVVSNSLSSLISTDSEELASLFTITDGEPFDYYNQLQVLFPTVSKMGLFAAKTPFLNGNPYTLFVDNQIYRGGAATLGIHRHTLDSPDISSKKSISTHSTDSIKSSGNSISADFTKRSGLYSISNEPLVITKCRGNIILEVDGKDKNASMLLVKQVNHTRDTGIESKMNNGKKQTDDLSNENTSVFAKLTDPKTGSSAFFPIVGGDLSKGALAIDTLMDIKPQTLLEFYRLNHLEKDNYQVKSGISFSVTPKEESLSKVSSSTLTSTSIGNGGVDSRNNNQSLVVSSEQGFVIGTLQTLGGYQVSSIPNSIITHSFDQDCKLETEYFV